VWIWNTSMTWLYLCSKNLWLAHFWSQISSYMWTNFLMSSSQCINYPKRNYRWYSHGLFCIIILWNEINALIRLYVRLQKKTTFWIRNVLKTKINLCSSNDYILSSRCHIILKWQSMSMELIFVLFSFVYVRSR
jgi:hypothetical protein